ncbi:MAG: hypothetical protein FWF51_06455 [Chitinivibrionia bacterium]|nr:hypothetical protein [Chitinivibrionia bacterium]MCL1946778.1 hypothetical protein [Chitinivibrionia bacterium]
MILGVSSGNLSSLYRQQSADYSKVLGQIASGKRFARPSDDFVGFVRHAETNTSIMAYQRVNDDLVRAKEAFDTIEGTGKAISEGLTELRGLVNQRTGMESTDTGYTELNNKITAMTANLKELLSENASDSYGRDLTGATSDTFNVTLADGGSKLSFDITDVSGALADLTDETKIKTAEAAISKWMAEASANSSAADRQLTINQNIISAKEGAAESIGAIDEVSAISKATSLQVRQQATVSMASQANLSQLTLARLFQ